MWFTLFFAFAASGVTGAWMWEKFSKGIKSFVVKAPLDVPVALLVNQQAWHRHFCALDKGQDCPSVNLERLTQAQVDSFVTKERQSVIKEYLRGLLPSIIGLKTFNVPAKLLLSCCLKGKKNDVYLAVGETTTMYVVVDHYNSSDAADFGVFMVNKNHCISPPPCPLGVPSWGTGRHAATTPDHYMVWLTPTVEMTTRLEPNEVAVWDKLDFSYRPQVSYGVIAFAQRMFVPLVVYRFGHHQMIMARELVGAPLPGDKVITSTSVALTFAGLQGAITSLTKQFNDIQDVLMANNQNTFVDNLQMNDVQLKLMEIVHANFKVDKLSEPLSYTDIDSLDDHIMGVVNTNLNFSMLENALPDCNFTTAHAAQLRSLGEMRLLSLPLSERESAQLISELVYPGVMQGLTLAAAEEAQVPDFALAKHKEIKGVLSLILEPIRCKCSEHAPIVSTGDQTVHTGSDDMPEGSSSRLAEADVRRLVLQGIQSQDNSNAIKHIMGEEFIGFLLKYKSQIISVILAQEEVAQFVMRLAPTPGAYDNQLVLTDEIRQQIVEMIVARLPDVALGIDEQTFETLIPRLRLVQWTQEGASENDPTFAKVTVGERQVHIQITPRNDSELAFGTGQPIVASPQSVNMSDEALLAIFESKISTLIPLIWTGLVRDTRLDQRVNSLVRSSFVKFGLPINDNRIDTLELFVSYVEHPMVTAFINELFNKFADNVPELLDSLHVLRWVADTRRPEHVAIAPVKVGADVKSVGISTNDLLELMGADDFSIETFFENLEFKSHLEGSIAAQYKVFVAEALQSPEAPLATVVYKHAPDLQPYALRSQTVSMESAVQLMGAVIQDYDLAILSRWPLQADAPNSLFRVMYSCPRVSDVVWTFSFTSGQTLKDVCLCSTSNTRVRAVHDALVRRSTWTRQPAATALFDMRVKVYTVLDRAFFERDGARGGNHNSMTLRELFLAVSEPWWSYVIL